MASVCIVFNSKNRSVDLDALINAFTADFAHSGFTWERESNIVTCIARGDEHSLRREAEAIGLQKERNDTSLLLWEDYTFDRHSQFKPWRDSGKPNSFFSPANCVELVLSILHEHQLNDSVAKWTQLLQGVRHESLHKAQFIVRLLQRLDLISAIVPLHEPEQALALLASARTGLDLQLCCDVLGAETTLYFAWMKFTTSALIPPALFGAAFWLLPSSNVETNPHVAFFSLFVCLWAIVYCSFWRRRQLDCSVRWLTSECEVKEHVRHEFVGEQRVSLITGDVELHFPRRKRIVAYSVSGVVTGAMLALAFGVMVCSLNLQGYITDVADPLHMPYFFDWHLRWFSKGVVLPLVPTMLHVTVILGLNHAYSRVAEWLTERENHRTFHEHRNAVVAKRVLFEAFDCYIALFYLAFVRLDILLLRQELTSLFTTDCLRRLAMETVLPYAQLSLFGQRGESRWSRKAQVAREEPDLDNEFLEMVIQLGYVTMFASAMPMAATIALLFTLVEMHSDIVKLVFVSRRPTCRRAATIGVWMWVIDVFAWASLFTNVFLFAFSSDQVVTWMPQYFENIDGDFDFKEGAARYVFGFCWLVEHLMIMVALLLAFVTPRVSHFAHEALGRKTHWEQARRKTELLAKLERAYKLKSD